MSYEDHLAINEKATSLITYEKAQPNQEDKIDSGTPDREEED